MVALMCLGEFSRANDLIKRLMTLYLFSTGAERQLINVLSNLGVASSYSTLISSRLRRHRKTRKTRQPSGSVPPPSTEPNNAASTSTPPTASATPALIVESPATPNVTPTAEPGLSGQEGQRLGTLYQLSDSVREEARAIARTGLYGVVYDNININFANAEQIIGRHGELRLISICVCL